MSPEEEAHYRAQGWWHDGYNWRPPMQQQLPPPKKPNKAPASIGSAVAIFVLAVVIFIWINHTDKTAGSSTSARQDLAYLECQDFVKAQLKAPATASFPGITSSDYPTITGSGDGPFEVVGVVDSANSFGAKLRSSFDCTTTASGDAWTDDGTTVTQQ